MAADTTKVAVNSAGAFVYLYDLLVAARTAAGQVPVLTSAARRITFIASAAMRITTDPVGAPVGIPLAIDTPKEFVSGSRLANEDIRHWFVKGVGDLEVVQEY